jgi:hypothetical protein
MHLVIDNWHADPELQEAMFWEYEEKRDEDGQRCYDNLNNTDFWRELDRAVADSIPISTEDPGASAAPKAIGLKVRVFLDATNLDSNGKDKAKPLLVQTASPGGEKVGNLSGQPIRHRQQGVNEGTYYDVLQNVTSRSFKDFLEVCPAPLRGPLKKTMAAATSHLVGQEHAERFRASELVYTKLRITDPDGSSFFISADPKLGSGHLRFNHVMLSFEDEHVLAEVYGFISPATPSTSSSSDQWGSMYLLCCRYKLCTATPSTRHSCHAQESFLHGACGDHPPYQHWKKEAACTMESVTSIAGPAVCFPDETSAERERALSASTEFQGAGVWVWTVDPALFNGHMDANAIAVPPKAIEQQIKLRAAATGGGGPLLPSPNDAAPPAAVRTSSTGPTKRTLRQTPAPAAAVAVSRAPPPVVVPPPRTRNQELFAGHRRPEPIPNSDPRKRQRSKSIRFQD